MKSIFNMIIAFLMYPFTRHKFKNKNIWLVGGSAGELYVDNARAIYEYLRTKDEVDVFWVVNNGNQIINQIPGNKLIKGSVDSYLYFMNCKVALFSHSISADIVPNLFVIPIINIFHYKKLKVFLNHGTVGFKKRVSMNPKLEKIIEKLITSYDINISDSKFEKEIKRDDWKISDDKIFITGYPRYDKLYNILDGSKNILYMPTWRNWIRLENQKIEETEYFHKIIELITNDKLCNYLNKNNITMEIYIHQLMQKYMENFKALKLNGCIKILSKDVNINDKIMTSKMLITDYSSISYDFYYLDKPVLFFQFDKDEYMKKVGSYVDLNKEYFGTKAYNVDECINKIIEISNNLFTYSNIDREISKINKNKYFTYVDKKNCERVYEVIINGLKNNSK